MKLFLELKELRGGGRYVGGQKREGGRAFRLKRSQKKSCEKKNLDEKEVALNFNLLDIKHL